MNIKILKFRSLLEHNEMFDSEDKYQIIQFVVGIRSSKMCTNGNASNKNYIFFFCKRWQNQGFDQIDSGS